MRQFLILFRLAILCLGGCTQSRKRTNVDVSPVDVSLDMEHVVTARRGTCAPFNGGDMTAAVEPLDAQIQGTEPREFPRRGTYHGQDGVKQYLTQPRAAGAEVNSEPERFIMAGNRIVVLVRNHWQDASLADVYTIRNGRVVEMQAFADRRQALRSVGAEAERDR
jgi:hypothetical protein